ncbi:MAG TPA: beta-galactosidase trimerization domain-containing protein [Candidatus Brocadiia bacterium]|nr:beta-galactosidase trimerization domain-containing protein [Candidatus Brocadiia bacterium]
MNTNWYANTLCKIHFDMHTPEDVENVGAEFDPDAFAAAVESTGAEAVCFFSRCAYGWSYYPTSVGLPHPHLKRDLFGDGVRALKERGIGVLAYYAIDNIPAPMAEKHPEWRRRGTDGQPVPGHGKSAFVCAFSRFPEEMLIPQFCEIAERYPVDGFFLDGVYQYFHGVCYCDCCRQAFGRDIPREQNDPNWRAYRHFQMKRVWDVMERAARAIDRARSGCLLGVNWLSSVWWSVPPPPSIGYLTGDPPLQNCSFETAFHLATWAWRPQPADLMTERMLHHWQDFTCRVPETVKTEFATSIACNGRLFIGDLLQPVKVQPDPEVMRLLKGCFDFAKQRQPLADGIRRRSDIAILSSPEMVRKCGNGWMIDDAPLRGTYLAVMEDGLTADILYDADLESEIKRYKVLVVSEQSFVGRGTAEAIREFVQQGGGLVIIGCIPRAVDATESDSMASPGVFEDITGLADAGVLSSDLAYLSLRGTKAEGFWRDQDDFRPAIPVPGKSASVRAARAEVLACITEPGQTYQIGAKPPGRLLDAPALTRNCFGNGMVMFCALPLATDLWKRGNPGAKYVIQKMIRASAPDLTAERIGPTSIHLTRSDSKTATVLHLVSYQPDRRTGTPQIVESPCVVSGVQVRLCDSRTPACVIAQPQDITVLARREGSWLVIEVPSFTIHTAIVIRWEP